MVSLGVWLVTLALVGDGDGEPALVPPPVPNVAQVVQLNGQVTIVHGHDTEENVADLHQADMVHVTDKISTQSTSWVRLLLDEGSVIDVAPDSALSIEVFRRQSESHVSIRLRALNGRLWAHIKPREEGEPDFTIATAQATANVRGTSFIVDVTDSDTTVLTAATGHVSLYPGYLLGDARPSEVFGRQSAVVQGTQWPPQVTQVSVETLRELRQALTPRPALDSQSAMERMSRLEERQKGADGVVAKAGLPLQRIPSSQPTMVAPPLSLDQGARSAQVNVTVQIND